MAHPEKEGENNRYKRIEFWNQRFFSLPLKTTSVSCLALLKDGCPFNETRASWCQAGIYSYSNNFTEISKIYQENKISSGMWHRVWRLKYTQELKKNLVLVSCCVMHKTASSFGWHLCGTTSSLKLSRRTPSRPSTENLKAIGPPSSP